MPVPRYIRVNLDTQDPALKPVFDFAAAAYPGQPVVAAVRELIVTGLGTDPLRPATAAARHSAYAAASLIVRSKIANALREIASDLDLQVAHLRERINAPCDVCGHVRKDV